MVIDYTFAIDMSQITMPPVLEELTYMLPGADVEGSNTAWDFLLQLAERISVLTEVTPVLYFDKNLEVDISELSINNEFFYLKEAIYNEEENSLTLVMKWHRQEKPIDKAVANPLCILSGIKLTPKKDAAWNSNEILSVTNKGSIGYDIYLRANALYSFSQKPENQEFFGIFPFTNVREDGVQENGGHFQSVYKEFEDSFILSKGEKDGWVVEGGGFAYYKDGQKYVGVKEVDGFYYDFGDNGVNIGQKKYTGAFFDADGKEYYSVDGEKYYGWMVLDMKNVRYYNPETGVREALTMDETPSTCIIDGHCIYTSESGVVKRVDYDDAGGHEYVERIPGLFQCHVCDHIRIEMQDAIVTLSTYLYTYNGVAKTPATTVISADGRPVTKPGQTDYPDYYSKYYNNVEVGTAYVTLTASKYGKYSNLNTWRGNAAGSITVYYEIRPDLPTGITAALNGENAVITWTAAKCPDVTYVLYRSNDGQNWTEFDTTTATTYTLSSNDFSKYTFKIGTRKVVDGKAYDSINLSGEIRVAVNVSISTNTETKKPTLKWNTVKGAVEYHVYRATAIDGTYVKVFTTAGTTYTHASATEGKVYYYKVVAIYADGTTSLFSNTVSNSVALDKVIGLTVSKDEDGSPLLKWDAVTGANQYFVYRATEDGVFVQIATVKGGQFLDERTTNGTTYYYMVVAVGADNQKGAASTVVAITSTATQKVPNEITSDDYVVGDEHIGKIEIGSTVAEVISGIHQKDYINIYKDGVKLDGNVIIGTGMVIKLEDNGVEYDSVVVVVTGDVNGDGNVSLTDMLLMKADLLQKSELTGAYENAADVNASGDFGLTDFIKMKAHLLGKETLKAVAVPAATNNNTASRTTATIPSAATNSLAMVTRNVYLQSTSVSKRR